MKLIGLSLGVLGIASVVQAGGFTKFPEKNFQGTPSWSDGNPCRIGWPGNPDQTSFRFWKSIRADPGFVCFFYTGNNCAGGSCEICVDEQGWSDTTIFRGVTGNSYKCIPADRYKCGNAQCRYK
ncbi:uncharacterized protein VTP21DRAFT_8915 [Calcarisporiella thermophila]|uniref:uncharacterized protein n=1 Tax=Calcarisporiella thermophila TaxID=911321 RepID=UPI003743003A